MAVDLIQPVTNNAKTLAEDTGALPENSSANALLHELQLGEQLNHCVTDTRRADFSLMLAMLSEDVREHSQFLLPKAAETEVVEYNNRMMRKSFNLPDKAPLALSSVDEIKQFNQAQAIADDNMVSVKLANAMTPNALAFRDNKKHINTEIIENTNLLTQLKLKQSQIHEVQSLESLQTKSSNMTEKPLNQSFQFNAKAWLDGIEESIVKAPLLN